MISRRAMTWRYGALYFGLPTGLVGGLLWWIERRGWPPTSLTRFAIIMLVWMLAGLFWGAVFGRIMDRFLNPRS